MPFETALAAWLQDQGQHRVGALPPNTTRGWGLRELPGHRGAGFTGQEPVKIRTTIGTALQLVGQKTPGS